MTVLRLLWIVLSICSLMGCNDQEARATSTLARPATSVADAPATRGGTAVISSTTSVASATSTVYVVQSLRVESYSTIQQLLAQSIAVVRVTATTPSVVEVVTVVVPTIGVLDVSSATVSVVRVDQVLFGSVSGPEIKVRQNGTGRMNIRGEAPLMEAGKSYVLFLRRFTYGPGMDTDQYIAVGGSAGLYADDGGTLRRLDPESPRLPATISLTEVQRIIAAGVPTAVIPSAVVTALPGSGATPSP